MKTHLRQGVLLTVLMSMAFAAMAAGYHWYDGDKLQGLTMSPDLVAEFRPPGGAPGGAGITPPGASELHNLGAVKIWKLDGNMDVGATIQATRTSNPAANVSPVFLSNGQRMALPGNVIIEFKPGLGQAKIDAWLRSNQYEVERTLLNGKFYVIKTPAGMEALDTANRIYQSGMVVRSQPNWWREFSPR